MEGKTPRESSIRPRLQVGGGEELSRQREQHVPKPGGEDDTMGSWNKGPSRRLEVSGVRKNEALSSIGLFVSSASPTLC